MMTETYPADAEPAAGSAATPVPRSAMAGLPTDRRVLYSYLGIVTGAFLVLVMARRTMKDLMP